MNNTQDLLFEIGCEELPPKTLNKMSKALLDAVVEQLAKLKLSYSSTQYYASPRRLAFMIAELQSKQDDIHTQRFGPPVSTAVDNTGIPTNAAIGFAKSCNTTFENLQTIETPKGKRLAFTIEEKGKLTESLLPQIITTAIKKIPISKLMRWSNHQYAFVRPVHWLLFIYGEKVIDLNLFGKQASNVTYGHRFMSSGPLEVNHVEKYVDILKNNGYVIVDIEQRQQLIKTKLKEIATQKQLNVVIDNDLLDEVSAIVEYPVALYCEFDKDFLRVPQESLITAMQSHQKCFPVIDNNGNLVNGFITISNINSKQPEVVIKGNQKVMAARLSDAAFFYDSDVKIPLEQFNKKLKNVIFQKQLGTVQDKVNRIEKIASYIGHLIGIEEDLIKRAAKLSKADLVTDMVFEFPELQGLMGYYYAKAQGENKNVALALNEQYLPKFSGDNLPKTKVGLCLSLADKIDTLVGIFGIGQKPTGDKDPFALRRAVIGILRILKEESLDINFNDLLYYTKKAYQVKLAPDTIELIEQFAMERLKGLYKEEGVEVDVFDSVKSTSPKTIVDFNNRVVAVLAFKEKESSQALAQANKRISNILAKNTLKVSSKVSEQLFQELQEKQLYTQLEENRTAIDSHINNNDYLLAFDVLGTLNQPINLFFENVMVMSDDEAVRQNRLALLEDIHQQFKKVADISKLSH